MVSLMQRRRIMMQTQSGGGGILPAGYTEVEYIEGTGTQYIITEIVPLDTMVECDFQYSNIASNADGYIVAKYDSNQRFYTCFKTSQNTFRMSARTGGQGWNALTFDTQRHTIVFNNSYEEAYFDGVLVRTDAAFKCTAGTTPLGLFCRNYSSDAQNISPGKIYSLKITDNSTGDVIGEFVPCIKNLTNETGMYDLVRNKFYGNDGTGDFIPGNPVT